MFVVSYEDGANPLHQDCSELLEHGDHVVPGIVRERQQKDEIPIGEIKGVKRVR